MRLHATAGSRDHGPVTAVTVDPWWTAPEASWMVKIERARHHLDELRLLVHEYLQTEPWTVEREATGVPDQSLYRFHSSSPPPAIISTTAGDIVHNLRSALDNLAYGMAERNLRRELDQDEETAPSFPVYVDEDRFDDHMTKQLRVAKGKALHLQVRDRTALWGSHGVEALRAVQPFTDPAAVVARGVTGSTKSVRWNLLQRLSHLWNVDKHRHLMVTVMFPQGVAPYVVEDGEDSRTFYVDGYELQDGSALAVVDNDASKPPAEFKFHLVVADEIPYREISIGLGVDVREMMARYCDFTSKWIVPVIAQEWTRNGGP